MQRKFNYKSFRPGQEEAILSILKGEDTLVMLPTGSGKSLCYQLPAYLLEGTVLVVSPLLSLMQDQVKNLKALGEKKVVSLNSESTISERKRIFRGLADYRFIYISPEMLQNIKVIQALKSIKISMFIVDEAHCISHWGTDFRPDYLQLATVRKELNYPRTMALTATATKEVRTEIIRFLALDENKTKKIIKSVDRPNIKFIVKQAQGNKNQLLENYLKKLKGPGIVYFMSKKLADKWSKKLNEEFNIPTASYHSEIEGDDKTKIQEQFLKNEIKVVCATSAFGMGFDKKDIRFVIHYHLPASIEMYLQEVGRASRDGKESLGILLYQPGDEQIQKRFIESSLPDKRLLKKIFLNEKISQDEDEIMIKLAEHYNSLANNLEGIWNLVNERRQIKEKQLEFMMEYVFSKQCKREKLLNYFDEKIIESQKYCCSNCNSDESGLIKKVNEQISSESYKKTVKKIENWESIFESLYNKP